MELTPAPALSGISVVDCSDGLAGAYCTKLLADAGADVVVVEPPGGAAWRDTALFRFLHTSKRSVVVDRTTEQGVESLDCLLAAADIAVEEGVPGGDEHPL